MSPTEIIEAKYRPVSRPGTRELLLAQKDALRFIEDCRQMRLVILGLDFFREAIDGILPTTGPADYSSLYGRQGAVEESAAAARKLIDTGLPDRADWVSIVVREPKVG